MNLVLALVLLPFLALAAAADGLCAARVLQGRKAVVCTVDTARHAVRTLWKDAAGAPYGSLSGIATTATAATGPVLMAMNAYIATKRGFPRDAAVPLAEMPRITFRAFPALMLPVILLFGIYGGATTPTEAASVAAAYALFLSAVAYRGMSLADFRHLMLDAAKSTSVVGLIIASALVLNYLVASENIPALMSKKILAIETSPIVFLLAVNALFLVLGCLFDATTLILIVIPLFLPAAKALGLDMVHFGVVMTVNIMIGLVTPPYGVLLFVINGLTGIPLKDIIREVWPFIGVLVFALLTMVVWPDVVLWMPRMFGYQH
mgnify:CR=1 FL=1